MQAANHFYKVLDEKTIIVVPDNPQARRDYEDLVIRPSISRTATPSRSRTSSGR